MDLGIHDYFDEKDRRLGALIRKLPRNYSLEHSDEYYPQEADESIKIPARWCVLRFTGNFNEYYEPITEIISDEDSPEKALIKAFEELKVE